MKGSTLTLAPIWFPHWPAWMWTISLMVMCCLGGSLAANADPGPPDSEHSLGHVTRAWLPGYSPPIGQYKSRAPNTGL